MDDYFLAAQTAPENQAMLGMFRLTGDAKLWWKHHCRDNPTSSPSWEKMKQAVKERYLSPAHQALKMNEFYALRQLGLTLEEYYSKFVFLRSGDISEIRVPKGKILELLPEPHLKLLKRTKGIIKEGEEMEAVAEEEEQEGVQELL
ncbi:hypothetical protein L7F22_006675 [Adiantum nelumboides]|nr:hypothetical protein [Adiantum nelumboides]